MKALARWVSWWVIGGIEIQQPTSLIVAFSIVCRDLSATRANARRARPSPGARDLTTLIDRR